MTVLTPQSVPSPFVNIPNFDLVKLQITVKWRRPYSIPGHVIANVLRGAVAITFRRLVCPEQFFHDECAPCPLYESCAYGQLFAPSPPSDATQLRLQQDLPRPFVIEPPGLDPDQPQSSDRLTFQLILFGSAADWLPFFITTIERLGWDGVGRDRMPFDIESVIAQHPAGHETLFTKGDATLYLPQQRIKTSDIVALSLRARKATEESDDTNPSAEHSFRKTPPLTMGGGRGR